jgi:hypothetical protein
MNRCVRDVKSEEKNSTSLKVHPKRARIGLFGFLEHARNLGQEAVVR